MADWINKSEDGYEVYELVIPGEALYMLSAAYGEQVNIDGARHDDVQWYVDYSRLVGGDIESRRFVTTENLRPAKAMEWALTVTKT